MKTEYVEMRGGVDQITAPLAIPPGAMLDCINYEIAPGGKGYRTMNGYERYDGQPAPSDATYLKITFENGDTEITADDEVEGSISGATGVALIDAVLESGTYAGSDAAGYIVLGGVIGTFGKTDDLEVSSVAVAAVDTVGTAGSGAPDVETDNEWVELARAVVRARIAAVPGSGTPCGFSYKGDEYAIRDNALATAAILYKATSAGWVAQDLGEKLSFNTMTAAFTVGETVTGTVSGATAEIAKIVLTAADEGFLIIIDRTGDFEAETITDGKGGSATGEGASVANALSAGGTYEFIKYNFRGAASSQSVYGVNGIDPAFEWDGVLAFVETGMTTDAPTHLIAHKNYLFLAFPGGSLQHSSLTADITLPYVWSVVLGAAELMVGDEITKLVSIAGQPLIIFTENATKLLYGTGVDDWQIQDHSFEAGAKENSVQVLGQAVYVNNNMITALSATDAYGDFSMASLSDKVRKFMTARADLITTSVVALNSSQYRLYFSDAYFLTMSFAADGLAGFTFGKYDDVVYNAWHNEDGEMFFGATDGFIYQMDKGTSFDGSAKTTFLRLPFNFIGTSTIWKKFRKVLFEFDTSGANEVSMYFRPEFNYMNIGLPTAITGEIDIDAGAMIWDIDNWDEKLWGGEGELEQPEAYINGVSPQIGLLIWYSSATQRPYTINGIIIEYIPIGRRR
ncbi:MAG: hypothetical protein WDA41_09985 [Candidatus Neomarinimicrobiota bacterium]